MHNDPILTRLSSKNLIPNLQGSTKELIIEELLDTLITNSAVENSYKNELLELLLKREKEGSTGIGNGLALPHGRSEGVKDLAFAIGVHKEGIDFSSYDGKKANIIILTLTNLNTSNLYMTFLAFITRSMSNIEKLEQLKNATTAEEMHNILTN